MTQAEIKAWENSQIQSSFILENKKGRNEWTEARTRPDGKRVVIRIKIHLRQFEFLHPN
jgi:hypothetical protein